MLIGGAYLSEAWEEMTIIDIQPDSSRGVREQDDLVLFALCLRAEARGEHGLDPRWPSAQDPSALEEMLAIGCVIMNRSDRRHQPVREVILAPKQFSWLNDSTNMNFQNAAKLVHGGHSTQDSWRTATAAAFLAYFRMTPDISNGADHYHADYVEPAWAAQMAMVARWGRHKFFDSRRKP